MKIKDFYNGNEYEIESNEMRIVALNDAAIFVQFKVKSDWEQIRIGLNDFKKIMIEKFPSYWAEYEKSGADDFGGFFYNYGENETGETFIFK